MKSAERTPVSMMPPMAFLNAWLAALMLSRLRDPDPWESKFWAVLIALTGVLFVASSARECVGLWRALERGALYPLRVSVISLGLLSALGSIAAFVGSSHWEWLIPGVLAVYFAVVFARESGRLAQHHS